MKGKNNMTRLTIEIDKDIKQSFIEKAREEGYTMHGVILKWIKEYLRKKKSNA